MINAHLNKMPVEKALQLAEQRYMNRKKKKPVSLLSLNEVSTAEIKRLIQCALVAKRSPGLQRETLSGKSIVMLFQKTSTRTRCSFERAARSLGADSSYVDWKSSNFVLADLEDEIRVLSRYYDLVVARVNHHETLRVMAEHSEVPIINGLCDRMHPCQALADFMTISEYFGSPRDLTITYIGDGNNVCRSLIHGAVHFECRVNLCTPENYSLDEDTLTEAGDRVRIFKEPQQAVMDADIIYTDTWVSMGDEGESGERLAAFKGYQVNRQLLSQAPSHCLVMHCLPAHPGYEITADVLRSARSIVFDQAENRQYVQQAVMLWLLVHLPM